MNLSLPPLFLSPSPLLSSLPLPSPYPLTLTRCTQWRWLLQPLEVLWYIHWRALPQSSGYKLLTLDTAWGHMILCVLFNRKLTVHSSTSTAVSASSRTNRTSQRGLLWGPLRGVLPSITSTHKTRESSPTGVVYQKHCDSEQSCCWPPFKKG